MGKCCGASCDCNIQAGNGVTITGTGSLSDPFIVTTIAEVVHDVFPAATVASDAPDTGTANPLPAQPAGYLRVFITGTERFLPFY